MSKNLSTHQKMTAAEYKASTSLSFIFATRMLGLFMIMPVFSVYAKNIPGGDNVFLVGVALGAYGITQSLLYIFYGWASDKIGRKPVIATGLVIFAIGSFIAAYAPNIHWIIVGRIVQGMGAVSSAVIAFLADLTSEQNRTKAMAMVGASIGLSFSVAIIGSPIVFQWLGMEGLFFLIGALALVGVVVLFVAVPQAPKAVLPKTPFSVALKNVELLRLNFGVLVLHMSQTALFLIVPRLLVADGLAVSSHWKIYLPVMAIAFILMVPAIILAERHQKMKPVLLTAIAFILVSELLFSSTQHSLLSIAGILFVYFLGFNILEATQPSLVSKLAPGERKGVAVGVYNTTQSIGLALGGILGGFLLKHNGPDSVFILCATLLFVWLVVASFMKSPVKPVKNK